MRGSREGWGVRTPSEICKNKKILYIISRVRFLNKWREPPHLHSGFFFLDPCLSLIDFRKSQKSKWHGPKRPEVEITHHQLCLDIMFVCIYMYIYIFIYLKKISSWYDFVIDMIWGGGGFIRVSTRVIFFYPMRFLVTEENFKGWHQTWACSRSFEFSFY